MEQVKPVVESDLIYPIKKRLIYANSGVGLFILAIALFAFLLYFLNKKFEVFYDLVKEMKEVKPIVESLNRKVDENNRKADENAIKLDRIIAYFQIPLLPSTVSTPHSQHHEFPASKEEKKEILGGAARFKRTQQVEVSIENEEKD
ncbi:unnamed protein product [Meloidogyne enterolobii]|uniref:Uncharacterized protein n=1 Tax=Meloidogyne enterolobii TaxID=390850 RepID=A0ACB0YKE9_MELEN